MQESMSQGLKPCSYLAHSARAEARAYLRSKNSGETSKAGTTVKPRKQGPRQSLGSKDSGKPQEQSNGKSGVGGCGWARSRLDWDDSIISEG